MRTAFLIITIALIGGCRPDDAVIDLAGSGYPNKPGRIILSSCAVSGCHNELSKEAAAGLSLSTWDHLFEGGRSGPCVIPYRPDFSTLCYYVNTDKTLGVTLQPSMPLNMPALSKEDYLVLRDWIASGAPNRDGVVKFSDDPYRKKYYVSNLLCDEVTVFDAATRLPMRYVSVGSGLSAKYAGVIKVAPDGQYWYVSFLAGNLIKKFRCSDDAFVGSISLGAGSYHSFTITPDSKKAFCLDYALPGKIVYVDLQSMSVSATYTNGGNFFYPRGAAVNASSTVLYVGAQFGNYIYKIDISNPQSPVISEKQIDGTATSIYNSYLDPYEIMFTPDGSKYFVTCQYSSQVRVMQTSNDSLLAVLPMPYYPQQMSISSSTNYLFVSCPADTLSFPGKRGSVAVVDYTTNTLVTKLYAGWEPYGIGLDEEAKLLVVSNMNINTGGPGPHHVTNCGGRNGYASFVDLNTLTVSPKKIELANVPYSVAIRK